MMRMEAMCRRVLIERAGGYEQLKVNECRIAVEPKADEVVVETKAIGVNYADCVIRMGLYQSAKDYVGWPITPGFEFAGKVLACGKEVTDLKPGDEVFGVTRFGAYSTHVTVKRQLLYRLAPPLDFVTAAGFPVVFLTAYYPLFEMTRLRPGARVLVHSAAGGVGSALVQLAKLAGARVVGVVGSSHKVEVVRALGADLVIDKSREKLWRKTKEFSAQGYDVVLDANGVSTLKQSYDSLAPGGKLVVYGFHSMLPKVGGVPNYFKLAYHYLRTPRFNPLELTNRNRSVLAFNLSYLFDQTELFNEAMATLQRWLGEGKIKAPPTQAIAFDQVASAHQLLESGQTVGKLVLTL